MKTFLALTMTMLAVSVNGCADTTDSIERALETQILQLDKQGWEAWKNNDPAWFIENTTESFRSISSSGISTKADVVRAVPTDCQVTAYSLHDIDFTLLDRNAALLTYAATQDAVCGGVKAPSSIQAAAIYVKLGGRWLETMYMQAP